MDSRIIEITDAAHQHGNLNLSSCGKEFFPGDVFGGSSRAKGIGTFIVLKISGINHFIKTDIPTDGTTGKPRWFFRERSWVKFFVRTHQLKTGDKIIITRSSERTYKISPVNGSKKKTQQTEDDIKLDSFGLHKLKNDKAVEKTKFAWLQPKLINNYENGNTSDYGTFKDSLNAPIHRWFKYPAGYSYRLVEEKIRAYGLTNKHWILDPFVVSGTTCLESRRIFIISIGFEAHSFVHWVAKTKLMWDVNIEEVARTYKKVIQCAEVLLGKKKIDTGGLPELLKKCYSQANLENLLSIRDAISKQSRSPVITDFLNLALTDTLRNASKAATGWPYISPSKMHEKATQKDANKEFREQVRRMIDDLQFMKNTYNKKNPITKVILADAREPYNGFCRRKFDFALTSPPYLNNYDYADRTRLETYFFCWFKSWGEITEKVRDKLMISATTQVRRNSFGSDGGLHSEMKQVCPSLYQELHQKVNDLALRRMKKGGKKSYDYMVAGYFNDMMRVLKQVYLSLKPGCDFVLVLGDSAPYGVYIPTHEYLARLAAGIGFSSYEVEHLRTRGDKWKENPQRHKVKLNEVILTLKK